jgi:hypothetical protein
MATTSCHGRPREKRDKEDSGTDIPSKNDKPAGMESGKSLKSCTIKTKNPDFQGEIFRALRYTLRPSEGSGVFSL